MKTLHLLIAHYFLQVMKKLMNFKQNSCRKFEPKSIKSNLWDYFDAFFSLIGDITVTAHNNTDVAITDWALFSTCQENLMNF